MSAEILTSCTREIVTQLVQGNYDELVKRCKQSRLSSEDLRRVVEDYGRRLILPPDDAYDNLDVVEIKGATSPSWSVRAPLWTGEEGRSDLTLELTIAIGSGRPNIELDDLHVL